MPLAAAAAHQSKSHPACWTCRRAPAHCHSWYGLLGKAPYACCSPAQPACLVGPDGGGELQPRHGGSGHRDLTRCCAPKLQCKQAHVPARMLPPCSHHAAAAAHLHPEAAVHAPGATVVQPGNAEHDLRRAEACAMGRIMSRCAQSALNSMWHGSAACRWPLLQCGSGPRIPHEQHTPHTAVYP